MKIRYLFSLLILAGANLLAVPPVRVAVVSDKPEVSDRVAADLSKDAGLVVIERGQVDLLLSEGALDKAMGNAETQTRLGRMLGVDAFIHVRAVRDGEWQIEVVQGASGEVLASGSAQGSVEKVAGMARELLKSAHLPEHKAGARIAVIDFTTPDENAGVEDHSMALRLAAELRTRLGENGLDVLDRLASTQVSNEQALAANGFLDGMAKLAPMLGADFVITGQWSATGKSLRLSVLNLSGGKLQAQQSFDIAKGDGSMLSAPIMKWAVEQVAGKAASEQFAWVPSIDAEALEPFYKGVTLFQQGKVLEATAEFQKAYSLSDKFSEAYFWEARCYEAAGLQTMADAMRFFIDRRTVGYGVSKPVSAPAADGLTFLGVFDKNEDTAECQKLEILATDAIAKTSQRVLLPSNLAQLRDEYDVLVGVKNSRGVKWDEAPGFLTRRTLSGVLNKTEAGEELQLRISDTLNNALVASGTIALGKESGAWAGKIENGLGVLLSRSSAPGAAQEAAMEPLPTVEEIKAGMGRDGNVGILRLALKDPASLATDIKSLQKPGDELAKFLNFGLREYLLGEIPEDHPKRPWLELERIARFLPLYPEARYFTRNVLDPVKELERYAKGHPDTEAGAVAEYMLLWETMAHIPPAELEKRYTALGAKFHALANPHTLQEINYLASMTDHLRQLAIIAQDDPQRRIPLPKENFPHRMLPKIRDGGQIYLEQASDWRASEWEHFEVSAEDAVDEARAAFAFLGRGNNRFQVFPEWIQNQPHSHALVSYMTEALRQAESGAGLPLLNPFDAEAERKAYRNIVDYTYGELRREIHNVHNAKEIGQLEGYEIRRFFSELTRPGFRHTVSDAEFDGMRETFLKDVAEVEGRVGEPQRRVSGTEWLDWRKITRSLSPYTDQKYWSYNQGEVFDRNYMDTLAKNMAAASESSPLLDSTWFKRIHQYIYATLPPEVRADYYMAEYPKLLKDYANTDLSTDEMQKMMQYGATLLAGGRSAEAAELFQKVYDVPVSDLNRTRESTELRANAAFQLGAFAIDSGRKAEAVRLLRQVLELGDGQPIKLVEDGGWHPGYSESLQTLALRLLSDLREEMPGVAETGGVHRVMVRQEGYFPGEIPFYFHVPAGYDAKSGKKYRVLVLVPAANSGGADDCRAGSTWARFADEHGLFLLAPRFFEFWRSSIRAQQWSGEATLKALAQIKEQYSIDAGRLLLHGYGNGGAFAQRFAMWRPELCSAVSAHSSFLWEWYEAAEEGTHPLSDLKQVPFIVTGGEDDGGVDAAVSGSYAESLRFATFARGAGIPLIWKSLPHTAHRPTPEMEKLAQAFFAAILDGRKEEEHFTGDLRTWKYFRAGDKRIAAVPEQFREELPSREFAELWGEEAKQ